MLVYQLDSYRHWAHALGRDDLRLDFLGENLTVDDWPTTRCASATGTGSETRSWRSPSRASRATGRGMVPRRATRWRRCWSHTANRGSTAGSSPRATLRPATTSSRSPTGPKRMSVAEIDALLYLPGHPRDALDRAPPHPGAQPRLADVVAGAGRAGTELRRIDGQPGPHRRPPGRRRRPGRDSALCRFGPYTRRAARCASLTLADPGGAPAAGMATRPIDHAAAARRDRRRTVDPQLFAVQHGGQRHVPDQRQAGTQRGGQWLRPHPGAGGRSARRRRAAGRVLPHRSGHTGDPAVGRSGGDPGARHAARARRGGLAPTGLVAARRPGRIRARLRLRGARRFLDRLPGSRSHVFYSQPGSRPTGPGVDYTEPGRISVAALAGLGLPRDAHAYLCGPAVFMSELSCGSGGPWARTRPACTPRVFGARPGAHPRGRGRRGHSAHSRTGRPARGRQVQFARSGLAAAWDPA